MNAQLPDFNSKDEVRSWLRARRGSASTSAEGAERLPPLTHDELLRRQHARLLQKAGYSSTEVIDSSRPRLDLALEGGQISGHEAPIGLLGIFYTSLQSAITAVAQALTGAPTAAAQVPNYIREATILRSAAVFPSSYGMHLFGPSFTSDQEFNQEPLPGFPASERRAGSQLLEESVVTICDIIDATHFSNSSNGDAWEERLAERVVGLGQRAVKHLSDLSTLLGDAEVGVRLDWQPDTPRSRHSVLEPSGAKALRRISDGVQFIRTETRRLEGLLSAADIRRGTVGIQLDSGTIISARITEDLIVKLKEDVFARRVVALAEVSVVQYATGRERELYTLTSLDPVDPTRR